MTYQTRRAMLGGLGAALAASGLSSPALAQADPWADVVVAARALSPLQSILVARNGEMVLAEAVRGAGLDELANVKSVSKSLVALLLGAAIDRGVVPSVAATLGEVAPQLIPPGADSRVAALTLEDLVTLRAGLERTSGESYGAWVSSPDWVADALGRPFVDEPGRGMLYSTGSFHVLGAALAEASGETLLTLARDWLGRPLGIEIAPWTRAPEGYYLGGNEMALTPRAMLRVGEMLRQGGVWDGGQVISSAWIEASVRPVSMSRHSGLSYGYGWFLGTTSAGPMALAQGYGGQIIAATPGGAMAVAITSDATLPARNDGYFNDLLALVTDRVMVA